MKSLKSITKSFMALVFVLAVANVWGQNGLIGDGFDYNDWATTSNFFNSAGLSRILNVNSNGTGNSYFRLNVNWDGNFNQYGPNSTVDDYFITPGVEVPSSEIVYQSTTKAYYLNTNSAYEYVFKTKEAGNLPSNLGLIVFEVQGTYLSSVSSVSTHTVHENNDQTITATLDLSLNTGQGVYLRYTDDAWTTSTVVEMTGAGVTYTADIPSGVNSAGTTVSYYVFTSGDALSIAHDDADFYTINYNNNGGSNYSYTVLAYDLDSEAIAPAVQVTGTSISSLNDTPAEAQSVFTITIEDKGSGDGLPTTVNNIRLKPHTTNTADWTDTLQGIRIFNGATEITSPAVVITDTSIDIPFIIGDVEVPDGGSLDLTFQVYLNTSNIVDGSILSFMVDADDHGFVADNTGSQFVTTFPGGDFNSDDFPIEVTATELQFTTQPTNTQVSTSMAPAISVSATDTNGNIDTDYTSSISITSTGTLTGTPVSATAVAGVATYATLTHTAVGYNLSLTANDGSLPAVTSSPFNIFDAPETCSQLYFSEYGHYYNGMGTGANYLEIYNPTGITIDLSNYQLYLAFSTGSQATISLTGSLSAGDVYVVSDDQGNVPGADQTEANLNYSGDDTIYFQYNGGSGFDTIDVIGNGIDPGTGWTVDGIEDATNNNTLVRKKTVNKPNTDWTTSSASEWSVSSYTQANLFFHHSTCNYYPCSVTSETPLSLDFESAGGYTTNPDEFNLGNYRYFTRGTEDSLGSNVELGNVQGSNLFAVCDTDATDDPVILTIDPIVISGLENLKFSIMIAEDDSSDSPGQHWDVDTNMYIEYSIDNTNYDQNLIWVEASNGNDSEPAVDTNFNGIGDLLYLITDSFQEFTKDIPETGTTLYIRITFSDLDDWYQDIAIDNIKITGDRVNTSTYSAGSWDNAPDAGRKVTIDDNYNTSAGSIAACNCTVNTDKTLTVAGGDHLLSVGAIVNNGTIVVENEGSLVQIDDDAVNSGTGEYQIKKTTPQYADYDYIFWSSPVSNETAGSVFATNHPSYIWSFDTGNFLDLYDGYGHPQTSGAPDTFDDSGNDWQHMATGTILSPGVGYIAMGEGSDFPLDFTNIETDNTQSVVFDGGTINNGEIQVNVERDEYNETNAGAPGTYTGADSYHTNANLIGNPYPSAIDISLFKMANPLLEGTFYFWMHDTNISSGGGPWAYNFTNDDYSTVAVDGAGVVSITAAGNGGGGSSASRYVASGQGFFANVTGNGTLTFNNSMRVTGPNDAFRSTNTNIDKFWLNLSQENSTEIRQIYIGFHNQASDDYQAGQDAQRMENGNNLDFYSIISGDERHFAIQNLAAYDENKIVPLGVESREVGNYTINMVKGEGIFNSQAIYLFDHKLNLLHELSAMPYDFVITDLELGELADRFELRFVDETAGVEDEVLDTLIVYPNPSNGQFYFNWQGTETLDVQVFDIHGRMVRSKTLNKGESLYMNGLESGIYLAKVNLNGQEVIKKLMLR